MPALDIINKYHNLTKIENEFRILGATSILVLCLLEKEHIYAHITICFIALCFKPIQKRA